MVSGKNSDVEEELNEAMAEKPTGAKKASKGISKGRKPRGPCRPYKKFAQEKLDQLISSMQTRADTLDAKLRMCNVRLKAYQAEASMREQDDA